MEHTLDARNIDIYYVFCMLNVAHVKNDVKWRPIVTKFGTLIDNMSRSGLYDCHICLIFVYDFIRNSNFGIGVLHVKRQILMYFFVTSFLCSHKFVLFHRIEYPKRCLWKKFYGSVFVIWLYLQKAMYGPCDLDIWPMIVNYFRAMDYDL